MVFYDVNASKWVDTKNKNKYDFSLMTKQVCFKGALDVVMENTRILPKNLIYHLSTSWMRHVG